MLTELIWSLASIMELKRLIRISNFIYPLTLILAIPFYLLLYGASGHRFNIPNEDIFWICVVCGAILTFYINRRTNKLISKILTAAFATIILYGSVQIAWSQLNFTFGDDIGILVVFLLMSWPLVFLAATGIYIYSLFLRTTWTSRESFTSSELWVTLYLQASSIWTWELSSVNLAYRTNIALHAEQNSWNISGHTSSFGTLLDL